MFKVTGAARARRQQDDIRLLTLPVRQTGQTAVLRLQKTRQPFDRRFTVDTRQGPRQGNAVFQRVACTRRRLGPVGQHLPAALAVAHQIRTMKNQQWSLYLRRTVSGRKQKARMGKDQLRRQQAFADDAPRTVEVIQNMLKQAAALTQASFEFIPLLGTNHPGQTVQLPGTELARVIFIGVEGNAILMQQILGFFPTSNEHVRAETRDVLQQCLPGGTRLLILAQQLVVPGASRILPKDGLDGRSQIHSLLHAAVPGDG